MKHFKTVVYDCLNKDGGCGSCQSSCQSACKTSCTIANQECEAKK